MVTTGRFPLSELNILLLTPYTGGNLGDAAIQEALIHHIRKRFPAPEIHLITLCPRVTSDLHGLPSFPIGIFNFDGDVSYETSLASANGKSIARFRPQGQQTVRRRNWIYRTIRVPWRGVKFAVSCMLRAQAEIVHSAQALRLLKGADLLVIAGGGQIDDYWGGPFGHPCSLFKWACLARMSHTPVVFLSVGVGSLRSFWSRYFAHGALRLAKYRSYRDDESKRLLSDATFTHSDSVYPDLAFSHPAAKEEAPAGRSFINAGFVVGFSPIAFFAPRVWPEHNEPVYQRYIKLLSEFLTRILEANHAVVLFTTSLMDKVAVKDLLAALSATSVREPQLARLRSLDQIGLNQQLAEIEKMDIVIASRLHGVILAHLLGKPALAISYDRKVCAHMKAMAQERFCLDLCDCTLSQLWDRFTALASEKEMIGGGICQRVGEYRQQLDRQYEFFDEL